jgi:EAL and modified HD-GYP domain-containing signal transduction protein
LDSFIARQPIFDRNRAVIGYELFFRDGLSNVFDFPDPTQATSKVMLNSLTLFNIEVLAGGHKAFINLTRDVLIKDYAHLFTPAQIACEILEDIPADLEAVAACRRLKKWGFTIVLDDYTWKESTEELVELADIVKVDFMALEQRELQETTKLLQGLGVTLLAEKVETYEDFEKAFSMGFHLFQGYFFAKPELMKRQDLPTSKMNCLRLISEAQKPEPDFGEVEKIVKQDMTLSYRLLRYINSAYFGFKVEIRSIKQAVVLLGAREFSRWATLIAMSGLSDGKPTELFCVALTRARFLEQLAAPLGLGKHAEDLFLVGMFSLLDAAMDRPFDELLDDIPVSCDVKDALAMRGGPFLKALRGVLCFEKAQWAAFFKELPALAQLEFSAPNAYISSVAWANKSLASF